jgi:sec-independent protein translocase protein TatA
LLVVLLLFGAKRIPEIAQGMGKGIREFKKAMRNAKDEINDVDQPEKPKIEKKDEPGGPTQG